MKKWFAMLLVLCVLMGAASVMAETNYKIQNGTLYVYSELLTLPDGEYDLICVEKKGNLNLSEEVFRNVNNKGKISNGIFRGTVTNYEDINGGTFFGTVTCDNRGIIRDGVFHGTVNSYTDCEILGGTFTEQSEVINRLRSEIKGGTFSGRVFNGSFSIGGRESVISGGLFTETSEVNNGKKGIISGGIFKGTLYYLICVQTEGPENGSTVIASVDSAITDKAMADETVRLTVVPETGFELTALTAADADGSAVALSRVGEHDYRFSMPANVVYITAAFNECPPVQEPPATGDPSSPALWLAMSILSMAGMLLLRKKAYSR